MVGSVIWHEWGRYFHQPKAIENTAHMPWNDVLIPYYNNYNMIFSLMWYYYTGYCGIILACSHTIDILSMSVSMSVETYIYIYLQIIFTPQLAGFARQLGCPKIVLDHVHVYLPYIWKFSLIYFHCFARLKSCVTRNFKCSVLLSFSWQIQSNIPLNLMFLITQLLKQAKP